MVKNGIRPVHPGDILLEVEQPLVNRSGQIGWVTGRHASASR